MDRPRIAKTAVFQESMEISMRGRDLPLEISIGGAGGSIEIYPREISMKYRDEAGRSRWEGSRRDEAA